MKTKLFILFQYLAPQHLLSRLAGKIAHCTYPPIKNAIITWFVDRYQVEMDDAIETDPQAYRHFIDFFTRALRPDARPIAADSKALISPADGMVSQIGHIEEGRIFQAKGQSFSALELLGGDQDTANRFNKGLFATIYLSPRDYHRVHMPLDGQLISMTYVPGDLFSVNNVTAQNVPRLFARNERVVCVFSTEIGLMSVVLVGAMIVGSIEMAWLGTIAPLQKRVLQWRYDATGPQYFKKGDELGRFKLGSTAIVLCEGESIAWDSSIDANSSVKMGQKIAD